MADRKTADDRPVFDHIAFAVPHLERPAQLVQDVLGAEFLRGADSPKYGFRSAQFSVRGGAKIEFLMPLDVPQAALLQRFLKERGPGVHHITFVTEDVVALESRVLECGWKTTDSDFTEPHWRETYIGPRQGLGTILQLADTNLDWAAFDPDHTFADVLAGTREWQEGRSLPKA
jgi:methylmalonyl-CoA/ethylmalonyl-CoA epimerase